MEDLVKVQKKIDELNAVRKGWIAAEGINALTSVSGDIIAKKDIHYNPNVGYPVKIFINTEDGEIKTFAAVLFEKDAS